MTALDGVNGTVCDARQYQESLQSYGSRTPSISCLTHGDSVGLIVSTYLTVSVSDTKPIQFTVDG